ncbi:MAG: leucine-rich repeat domain-containing protein [Muribaculaceae bacterium]|nr:leucine-rich repeat domain-containing protein [Muribaculaceae bacterium]
MNNSYLSHIVFCLAIITSCLSPLAAQEWVSGGLRYRAIGDDEAAVAPWITDGVSAYADVVIVPETVYYNGANYRVTAVADSAFYNSAITELQLPNTVTHIGRWAMADAFDLHSVTLPLHLEQVSRGMLAGTDITSILIPEGVTRIDDSAFEDCNHLHTVFLPPALTEVGDYAFDGCHNLFEVYSTASHPPVWMGDDAMPAVSGVDLVLPDERAVQAWRADSCWGDHHRYSLWVSDNVVPSFELHNEPWGDNWSRVELGRCLAYRIYGEDGYQMALTTADHYYLPIGDHNAEYVVVPTDGTNDSDDATTVVVNASQTGIADLASERTHPLIYALDGVLHIEGDNHGTWTSVYDVYGRRYYYRPSNDGQILTLHPDRVYIVIVGDYVQKVRL